MSARAGNLRSVDAYAGASLGLGARSPSAVAVLLEDLVERVAERLVQKLEERGVRSLVPDEGELLSVPEAAAVLRCKPQRLYDLRSAGRLPRTTEGGRAVVRRSDLERLVAES